MQLPRLDTASLRLLRKVRCGRDGSLPNGGIFALDYRRASGNGVLLAATLGTATVRLWIEGATWCRWIEPILTLDDIASMPEALAPSLAAWTCASLSPDYDDGNDDPPSGPDDWPIGVALTPAALRSTHGWGLTITRDGRRLDALVLDAPLSWLDALADRLEPIDPSHLTRSADPGDLSEAGESAATAMPAPPRLRASLLAGWTRLPASTVKRLAVGEALVLQYAFDVADHQFGLFLTRPLARVRCETTDNIEIDYIMDTFDDWLDVEPDIAHDAADIDAREPLVTIVAEVGTIDVPLSALAGLAVGDVLTGDASAGELVALKVAGRVIARATLLDIDGKLAARIEQI